MKPGFTITKGERNILKMEHLNEAIKIYIYHLNWFKKFMTTLMSTEKNI